MCVADFVDYSYAQSVETEDQYALREAEQYLHNRGYEIGPTRGMEVGFWRWTCKSMKGNVVANKQLAIISAFVHLAHNTRKL